MNATDNSLQLTTPTAERHRLLRDAETKAQLLFDTAEARGLIRAGINEKALNEELYQLAFEMFGIKKYWHKRIVRAGSNTLMPYRENPPDLVIKDDDIIFFDFGPVFEDWEADFGRTYVLGTDPVKLRIKNDIETAWYEGKRYFDSQPEITGSEFYQFITGLASKFGWEFPQPHAGHLIGSFPHERLQGEDFDNYIHPSNKRSMREPDKKGAPRDWILEVHFVDRKREIGGFFEQLLTVD
jgi:Xaa-Pro dipeptidase